MSRERSTSSGESSTTKLVKTRSSSFGTTHQSSFLSFASTNLFSPSQTVTATDKVWKWTIDEERDVLEYTFMQLPNWKRSASKSGRISDIIRNLLVLDDWNLYWSVKRENTESLFNASLRDDQYINHFPNSSQLTRKDFMYINWRNYCKHLFETSSSNIKDAGE